MNYEERLLLYNEYLEHKDGKLYWLKANSNRIKVSSRAGTVTKGFIGISINKVKYYEHDIVYELLKGELVSGDCLTHLDGDNTNNFIDNLRKNETFEEALEREGAIKSLWQSLFYYYEGMLYRHSNDKKIGCPNGSGYNQFYFGKKYFRMGRAIWEYHFGEIADSLEIDHINCIKEDDRIENLRLATPHENMCNHLVQPNNKLGIKGVSAYNNRFVAYIKENGSTKNLGYYDTPEEAKAAYDAAALELHGEFARL
jgi:hypothetical protein